MDKSGENKSLVVIDTRRNRDSLHVAFVLYAFTMCADFLNYILYAKVLINVMYWLG